MLNKCPLEGKNTNDCHAVTSMKDESVLQWTIREWVSSYYGLHDACLSAAGMAFLLSSFRHEQCNFIFIDTHHASPRS